MLIGLTTSLNKYRESERVNLHYITCIEDAGGIPILLPPLETERDIEELIGHLSGIVLTGGGDIDPSLYGETEKLAQTTEVSRERDVFEIALVRKAHERNLPLFGICRGIQVMNVALGGILYQDIRACGATDNNHFQEKPYTASSHTIGIFPNTKLASFFPTCRTLSDYPVNSIHHQGIKGVAQSLVVSAVSDDGIIEGIEDPTKSFFVGVQWHPEFLESDRTLFENFCKVADLYVNP